MLAFFERLRLCPVEQVRVVAAFAQRSKDIIHRPPARRAQGLAVPPEHREIPISLHLCEWREQRHFDLWRQLEVVRFEPAQQERAPKTAARTRPAVGDPFLPACGVVKDGGRDEVEQVEEVARMVVHRRPREEQRERRWRAKSELVQEAAVHDRISILQTMRLVDDGAAPAAALAERVSVGENRLVRCEQRARLTKSQPRQSRAGLGARGGGARMPKHRERGVEARELVCPS
mmetsp:Transcript_13247/g.25744  ORF Transcript_13247/g.25744 Transcript_13247/m.25744 type:complete len:232 (-) Transcript_13247:567-1262(-)